MSGSSAPLLCLPPQPPLPAALIRKQYLSAEQAAAKKFEVKKSANW